MSRIDDAITQAEAALDWQRWALRAMRDLLADNRRLRQENRDLRSQLANDFRTVLGQPAGTDDLVPQLPTDYIDLQAPMSARDALAVISQLIEATEPKSK